MSKYKVGFYVNSRANVYSANAEVIDLIDDYGYTEKEAEEIINDEEKLEKECEEIWDEWYEKVQKEQLTKDNLAIMDALMGALSKQQEVKYDNKGATGKRNGQTGN